MELCRFRDALGRPREGFHAPRLCGVALLDVLGTIFLAYILHRLSRWPWAASLLAMFALGVLCHRLFCVSTTLDKILFSTDSVMR